MSKRIAIAQFDYVAEAPDELSLKVGDVITNIKQVEDGWCQGNLNGKVGMFPDNFVKMEEEKAPPPKAASVKAKKESKRYMKVTFAYDPANADELKLNVDDIIEVIQDEEEGWAQGSINGRKGVFPTNFCVQYTPDSTTPAAVEEPKEPEPKTERSQVAPKKVHGVGFGNIFGGGPIKLKSAGGDVTVHEKTNKKSTDEKPSMQNKKEEKPVNKVAEEKAAPTGGPGKDKMNRAAQPRSSTRQSKPVEKCRVQFEYTATTSDELTLVVGDIITVINKNCEDDGWWEGEVVDKNGRKQRGVFPDNFVVLLPPESEPDTPASEESEENAAPDTKAKENHVEPTDSPKEKPSSPPPSNNSSQKKPSPQAPPANSKPQVEDTTVSDLDAVVDSASSDTQQLIHYRRVSGPKNRRRPDSTHRRERAKEAAEEAAAVAAEVDSEPESPKAEPDSAPQAAPKKELPKGIPVMPVLPGMGSDKPGEKPSWLKNLKRTSVKKEIPPKPEEPANKTPEWLANMRKKEKKETPVIASKPAPGVTSPKPNFHANRASLISPVGHTPPLRPTSPKAAEERIEKPTSFKRTPKKENNATTAVQSPEAEEAKPEVKKLPTRPPVPSQQPVGEIPKKPAPAAKPKPPPAKVKPVLPASKPHHASPAAMEELKEELKNLREQMNNFQKESMKEISRLTNELQEEKKQRISLQNEVANLQKKVG